MSDEVPFPGAADGDEPGSTDAVRYPILLYGKYGILHLYADAKDLIRSKADLRRWNKVDWFRVVDSEFREFKVARYRIVRSHGPFGGFYFIGPFLQRRVVFSAELTFLRKVTPADVGAIFVEQLRKADGISRAECDRYQASLEAFISAEKAPALDALFRHFDNFEDQPPDAGHE